MDRTEQREDREEIKENRDANYNRDKREERRERRERTEESRERIEKEYEKTELNVSPSALFRYLPFFIVSDLLTAHPARIACHQILKRLRRK